MAQLFDVVETTTCSFQPDHEDDEDQAQLESDFVARFLEQNDFYREFWGAVWDALLIGNGWLKIYVETITEVIESTHEGGGAQALEQLLTGDDNQIDIEVTAFNWLDKKAELWRATIERTIETPKMRFECIAPEYIMFSPSLSQFDIQTCRFVAERKLYTVSELIDMGVPKDEALATPSHQDEYWAGAVSREGEFYESSDKHVGGDQDATHLKECYHIWIQLDVNGNGQWEKYSAFVAGRDGSKLFDLTPEPTTPIITGSPIIIPHRIQGQGMYDLMEDIALSKTGVLRNYLDNLSVANQGGLVFNKQTITKEHLLSGRVNRVVANNGPVSDAVMGLPNTDIGAICIQGLNYLDEVGTKRAGAALDLSSAEGQIAKSSALAAAGEFANKEAMSGYFCANLVNTLLRDSYLLAHQTLRNNFAGRQLQAKINGKWVTTDPGQWPERAAIEINRGLTTSEKMRRSNKLQELLGMQNAWLGQGADGVLSSVKKVYNTASDWIRMNSLGQPEEYLIDPDSEQAMQAADAHAQQKSQMNQQMQLQQAQMMAFQRDIEELKAKNSLLEKLIDTEWKYFDTQVEAGLKTADMQLGVMQNAAGEIQQGEEQRGNGQGRRRRRAN